MDQAGRPDGSPFSGDFAASGSACYLAYLWLERVCCTIR